MITRPAPLTVRARATLIVHLSGGLTDGACLVTPNQRRIRSLGRSEQPGGYDEVATTLVEQASSGFVDLAGAELAWTRSGSRDGDSVLLAHGITDSAACWDRVAHLLAPVYGVIRYDARGHGGSDRATSYSFELHASDLIGVARALHLDRPVLIGHSMGGAHAAVAAVELHARAVVLEDPHWPEIPEDGTSHDIALVGEPSPSCPS